MSGGNNLTLSCDDAQRWRRGLLLRKMYYYIANGLTARARDGDGATIGHRSEHAMNDMNLKMSTVEGQSQTITLLVLDATAL